MTEYLSGTQLASYFDEPTNGTYENIAWRTNALIDEKWVTPVSPAPQWVINIAWDVAIRAGANPKGLTSKTSTFDDITDTERYGNESVGVFLTEDEETKLRDDPSTVTEKPVGVGSIRMRIPGWSPPVGWPQC